MYSIVKLLCFVDCFLYIMYIVMYCDMLIKEELKDEYVIKGVYYIYKISIIKDKIVLLILVMMELVVFMV